MALELDWPLVPNFCCVSRNVNHQTGANARKLGPEVLQHVAAKLAPDWEVYHEAVQVHHQQVATHGTAHATALARFASPAFAATCGHDLDAR